jgi:hypothetical protein
MRKWITLGGGVCRLLPAPLCGSRHPIIRPHQEARQISPPQRVKRRNVECRRSKRWPTTIGGDMATESSAALDSWCFRPVPTLPRCIWGFVSADRGNVRDGKVPLAIILPPAFTTRGVDGVSHDSWSASPTGIPEATSRGARGAERQQRGEAAGDACFGALHGKAVLTRNAGDLAEVIDGSTPTPISTSIFALLPGVSSHVTFLEFLSLKFEVSHAMGDPHRQPRRVVWTREETIDLLVNLDIFVRANRTRGKVHRDNLIRYLRRSSKRRNKQIEGKLQSIWRQWGGAPGSRGIERLLEYGISSLKDLPSDIRCEIEDSRKARELSSPRQLRSKGLLSEEYRTTKDRVRATSSVENTPTRAIRIARSRSTRSTTYQHDWTENPSFRMRTNESSVRTNLREKGTVRAK